MPGSNTGSAGLTQLIDSVQEVSLCEPCFVSAANAIERAVETAIAQGQATRDVGGQFGTAAAGEAIARLLASA